MINEKMTNKDYINAIIRIITKCSSTQALKEILDFAMKNAR